jgi:hypothetical protein
MKRYATTYSNGHTEEESSWVSASQWHKYDDEQKFFLSGKPVSSEVFFDAIQQARQKDFDKKIVLENRTKTVAKVISEEFKKNNKRFEKTHPTVGRPQPPMSHIARYVHVRCAQLRMYAVLSLRASNSRSNATRGRSG